jgi:hypothetical protein
MRQVSNPRQRRGSLERANIIVQPFQVRHPLIADANVIVDENWRIMLIGSPCLFHNVIE